MERRGQDARAGLAGTQDTGQRCTASCKATAPISLVCHRKQSPFTCVSQPSHRTNSSLAQRVNHTLGFQMTKSPLELCFQIHLPVWLLLKIWISGNEIGDGANLTLRRCQNHKYERRKSLPPKSTPLYWAYLQCSQAGYFLKISYITIHRNMGLWVIPGVL